jgi:hypothetical protein
MVEGRAYGEGDRGSEAWCCQRACVAAVREAGPLDVCRRREWTLLDSFHQKAFRDDDDAIDFGQREEGL